MGGLFEGNISHVVSIGEEMLVFYAYYWSGNEGRVVFEVEFRSESDTLGFFYYSNGFIGITNDTFNIEFGKVALHVLLESIEYALSNIGHDYWMAHNVIVGYFREGGERVGVTHDCVNMERDCALGFYAFFLEGGVHGKGEVYGVVAEVLVEMTGFAEIGIKAHFGVTLHEYECSLADVGSNKGAYA